MRLICPNCGAQYQVDDGLIPDAGRDVQCSNCGNSWFQQPAHLDAGLADELGIEADGTPVGPAAAADAPEDETLAEDPAEMAVAGNRDAPDDRYPDDPDPDDPNPDDAAADDDEATPDGADGTPGSQPVRPVMDDSIRAILQEEAERETRARHQDAGLHTQPDLGLEAASKPAGGMRERMARLRGLDVDDRADGTAAAVAAATAAGSRRELLPDIEEINSSLRSADERDLDEARMARPDQRTGGFGTGFLIVVLVVFVAVMVYVAADRIAEWLPAAAPALRAYVAWADTLRGWLDGVAQGWLQRVGAGT